MALKSEGRKILMNVGDFGVDLPFTMTGIQFEPDDKFLIIITKNNNAVKVIEKEYTNLAGGYLTQFSFVLSFTEEESAKLPKGVYNYTLIFLRESENIRNTVVSNEEFRVGDEV